MRWWVRLTLEAGTSSEHALPAGYGETWRLGAARGCDVRVPALGAAREVRFDRWQERWYVSAPGAVALGGGAAGFVGKEVGHGDGFTVAGARVEVVRRARWDDEEAFGALRAALHGRDWASAVDTLYAWPRGDLAAYDRAEGYARALLERVEAEELPRVEAPAVRALLEELTGRSRPARPRSRR